MKQEGGFTMVELIVTMAILLLVLSGVTALFVSGTKAQTDLQARFDTQTEVQVGLDKIRKDVHQSCSLSTQSATSVTFNVPNPDCVTTSQLTWCTQGSGTRYGLYRIVGASCTGGTRYSDFLISGTAFSYVAQNSPAGSYALARLHIDVTADANPADGAGRYRIVDDLVFRNSPRT